MTSQNRYEALLRQLDDALNSAPSALPKNQWAYEANRRSLETLRGKATMAALSHQRRARFRFYRGSVLGNAGPVHQILRCLTDLNEAVVVVANSMLLRPYAAVDDGLRARLGLLALPAVAGSFEIELAAPPLADNRSRTQRTPLDGEESALPGLDDVESVTSRALARVLDALRISTRADEVGDALEDSLQRLGKSGIRQLARIASRCEQGQFLVDITASTGGPDDGEEPFTFSPKDAAWLRAVIRNRALDVSSRTITGELLTASRVRNVFDIVTDEEGRISGTILESIRPSVVSLFDTRVQATIEERLDPADVNSERVTRRLVAVEPAPDAGGEQLSS